MNAQWILMVIVVILHFIQGSPLNTDGTSKSASPGQIVELIVNVVNLAKEVRKKLTDAPSTVINIRDRVDRTRKSITEDVRLKQSPRSLTIFGANENEKHEEDGVESLLERVLGWALERSGGGKPKVVDVQNCVRGKEQQLVNVEQEVKRELQKCFTLSHVSGEVQQVKNPSAELGKNLKGDVGRDYLAGEERKEKNKDTVLGDTVDDHNSKDEHGKMAEELMKVLLKGIGADVRGQMFDSDQYHEKEGNISSEETVDMKVMGKNNSKIPLMVVSDDKRSSEDMEDNAKTFPGSSVGIGRTVPESGDLGLDKGAGDAEQQTTEGGTTPNKNAEGRITKRTTPPVSTEEVHTSEPSASHSYPSNTSCVATAIEMGHQKIDDIVKETSHCVIQ